MKYIAPSVLSADFADLGNDVRKVSEAGAEFIHLDVMDGMFVPNISFGPGVIKKIRPYSNKIFDVHMMVEEPGRYIENMAKAGADYITIHAEASRHIDKDLNQIRSLGCKSGIVLCPGTPLSVLDWTLELCDMVLVMSVNPGFGNQKFIPYSLDKVRAIKEMINKKGLNTLIEIDGGVKLDNCVEIAEAGVDVLVAGSAIFDGDAVANVKAFNELLGKI